MRRAKLDADEIIAAEKAKDERQQSRKRGFSKMRERDASHARIRNLAGQDVIMQWNIPDENRDEGVAYLNIPDGLFALKVGKETAVFDAEEFRRSLRWV